MTSKDIKQAPTRLDKWLWAARFYKTRSIAKEAIEGGKVQLNGQRCKPSRAPQLGDAITLKQGWDEKTVVVKAISSQRRGAPEAQLLYEETSSSLERREQLAEQRKMQHSGDTQKRPNKKQRRLIHSFKQQHSD